MTRITGSLREDQHTFWSYLAQFCLELEVFRTKFVEKIETHHLCSTASFENRAVYVTVWENTLEPEKPQMTVMAHAHCMLHD